MSMLSAKNQVIPEIFDIIFSRLAKADLLNAILVCRTWHDSAWSHLWRHLREPSLTYMFFEQLEKHGYRVQTLSLLLDTASSSPNVIPIELSRVLRFMPRLSGLRLHLTKSGSENAVIALLKVLEDMLGPKRHKIDTIQYASGTNRSSSRDPSPVPHGTLNKLDIKIGTLRRDQVDILTRAFDGLTELVITGYVPPSAATLIAQKLPALFKFGIHHTDDEDDLENNHQGAVLQSISKQGLLPLLTDFAFTQAPTTTQLDLQAFADAHPRLARIDLTGCLTIQTAGLTYLVQKCTLLTHVKLSSTNVGDEALSHLASPSRASLLRVLHIANCEVLESLGLMAVITTCVNLEELDVSQSPRSMLDVFEGPMWACTRLRVLRYGRPETTRVREMTVFGRRQLFKQIGRLQNLHELALDNISDLKAMEAGRAALESLQKLEKLSLTFMPINSKELIWLMTQLTGLKTLVLTATEEFQSLLLDLLEINTKIQVVLQARAQRREPVIEDTDSDSDSDDNGAHHYPHPFYNYGFATDSDEDDHGVEEAVEEEDEMNSPEEDVHSDTSSDYQAHQVESDSEDLISNSSSEHHLQQYDSEDDEDMNSDDDDDDDDRQSYDSESSIRFGFYRDPYQSDDDSEDEDLSHHSIDSSDVITSDNDEESERVQSEEISDDDEPELEESDDDVPEVEESKESEPELEELQDDDDDDPELEEFEEEDDDDEPELEELEDDSPEDIDQDDEDIPDYYESDPISDDDSGPVSDIESDHVSDDSSDY